jgi:hypothetical protein
MFAFDCAPDPIASVGFVVIVLAVVVAVFFLARRK